MNNSLSLILPVHNAESWLARQIASLLDLLPELTPRFELLIVDDASTDHTLHVADDLAAEYPQLRVLRHIKRQGLAAAAQSGVRKAKNDVVLVQEDRSVSGAEIRRLWEARKEASKAVRALPQPHTIDATVIERLSAWGQSLQANPPAVVATNDVAVRRNEAILQLQPAGAAPETTSDSRTTPEAKRSDVPHAPRAVPPVRSFLKHLRELSPGP